MRVVDRPEPARCEGCGAVGHPHTSAGYCPQCADITCQVGGGALIGLPVPADVPAALRALERHMTVEHPGPEHGECLVCRLYGLAIVCTECGAEAGEGDHAVVCGHVVVGCEGYVTAAVRSAALAEAHAAN